MKPFVSLLALCGAVVLAFGLGSRIPPDMVAMGVGVVLGASASIPMSLFLGVVLNRNVQPVQPAAEPVHRSYPAQSSYQPAPVYSQHRSYPSLVIINSSDAQRAASPTYPPARFDTVPMLGGPRRFTVVGDEGA